jgi:hypothetical protein
LEPPPPCRAVRSDGNLDAPRLTCYTSTYMVPVRMTLSMGLSWRDCHYDSAYLLSAGGAMTFGANRCVTRYLIPGSQSWRLYFGIGSSIDGFLQPVLQCGTAFTQQPIGDFFVSLSQQCTLWTAMLLHARELSEAYPGIVLYGEACLISLTPSKYEQPSILNREGTAAIVP